MTKRARTEAVDRKNVTRNRMQENVPLITVIIPAYNCERYIGRCLDSVLRQSFQNFEILVIDDGSTDGTGKIVKKYANNHKKVQYIKQKNMGVARTRNKAIGLARGEFVAFIDNDDYIDEDYLEKLLPRNGEDVMVGGYRRSDVSGRVKLEVALDDAEWSKFVVMAPWAKIYRRDFLLKNKIKFLDNDIGEDVYFNLIVMSVTDNIKITNYVGYNWFLNGESVSNTSQRSFGNVDIFNLLDSSYNELKGRGVLERKRGFLELYYYRYIVWFLLFASKKQNKKEIGSMYDELFGWLKERFPGFEKNEFLKVGRLPGEVKSTRVIYEVFLRFYKIGLGKDLVWLYAKI